MENFVENVVPQRQNDMKLMQNKGFNIMNKTSQGPFTKKTVFKDPTKLIYTQAPASDDRTPLSGGARSVIDHLSMQDNDKPPTRNRRRHIT